jgi:hypothetical protein
VSKHGILSSYVLNDPIAFSGIGVGGKNYGVDSLDNLLMNLVEQV